MQRIRQRKYGRDGTSPHAAGASHIIKIGFDARGPRDTRPVPGRLRGFLLVRDSLDANNQLVVDMECMSKYGVTAEMVERAKREQLKAVGLLPTELRFVLTHDARKEEGRWLYPGTFSEEYETWGKLGRFCHGDGVVAHRRQEDGTRKQIECVPRGKEGTAAKDWCPFSVKGDCRARSRLVLCLYVEDRQSKRPMPVSDAFGWEARFRFDTTSEYNPVRILAALDEASSRLQGNLAGIPGTLSFAVQRKRTGNEDSPVGVVGQIMLSLSEHEIAKRERELWNRRLEEIRIHSITGSPPQSSLPPPPDGPLPIQEDEDQVVVPDDTEVVVQADQEPQQDTEPTMATDEAVSRDQVVAAAAKLLEDYPSARGVLAFDLADLFKVDTAEAIPEDRLPEALGLIRNIYRAERSKAQAQRE